MAVRGGAIWSASSSQRSCCVIAPRWRPTGWVIARWGRRSYATARQNRNYNSGRDFDHSAQYHGDTRFRITARLKCEDMSSPLDAVIALKRQGHFAEAL